MGFLWFSREEFQNIYIYIYLLTDDYKALYNEMIQA